VLLHVRLRNAYSLLKILLLLFFSVDLFGSYFYSVGQWSIENKLSSWLNTPGLFGTINELPGKEQLFLALYFALGTLSSTMGYGDIVKYYYS
jgi:hypothetical protein